MMILPTKHIKLSESLVGLGAYLLKYLDKPKTVDQLWTIFSKKINNTKKFPAYHNFDDVVLALNLLFMIGAVDINDKGEIYNASTGTQGK